MNPYRETERYVKIPDSLSKEDVELLFKAWDIAMEDGVEYKNFIKLLGSFMIDTDDETKKTPWGFFNMIKEASKSLLRI